MVRLQLAHLIYIHKRLGKECNDREKRPINLSEKAYSRPHFRTSQFARCTLFAGHDQQPIMHQVFVEQTLGLVGGLSYQQDDHQ